MAGLCLGFETCNLRHAGGKNLSNPKQSSISHGLSISGSHCPDMTEILLTRTKNSKSFIHLTLKLEDVIHITSLEYFQAI